MLLPPTMMRVGGGVLVAAVAAMSGCASAPPAAEKTIEPSATEDSAFVLSRNPAASKPAERVPVHVGDQWWAFRGDFLKVNEDKARDRDGDISEKQAPPGFWDLQTSVETISIWTTFCNECHGGRRKMEDVIKMPAWRGKLSKEQIWALIYFVEYQSGGIEGRFPPSLMPRESQSNQ
jgi:hypothetical protein